MSQKSKKTTKKPTSKKSSSTKKSSTAAKKPAAKKITAKKATSTAKKPATKTTKKPTTTKKPVARKPKVVKAIIMSYRRNNRLQTTNQAIAKILDEYNHKALIGKKFIIKFPESEATAKGTVIGIHGKDKSKQVRLRFTKSGMTAYAINLIAEIQL